ncbi:MAG: cytochrome b/b6 domain-containing protein, partial [Thiohalomonadaceae bacterium]
DEVKVWDLFVRVFHWTLVAAFATAYLSEDGPELVHVYAGYTVLALVVSRIVWGFVGTRYARFADFVPSFTALRRYLVAMLRGNPPHYVGHNPAGGAMIIALLVSLLLTTLTGLATYGGEGEGPLAGLVWQLGTNAEDAFEDVHEFFANLTLVLVGVHVVGVIVGSVLHRENLIRAMFTGRKRTH